MKCNSLFFFLAGILLLLNAQGFGQVLISDTAGTPDSSAMMEIRSTGKGLLLPRIDYNNRPQNPQPGLMIYVTSHGPLGNNNIYYYNGSSWVTFTMSTNYIGQYVFGGMVFYVDTTQMHGYVVMNYDLNTNYSIPWGCDSTLIGPSAQGTDFGAGQGNTAAIVAACTLEPNVAKVCDTLTLNGYTDWFLPSHDELDSIHAHMTVLGIPAEWYWSSSEYDTYAAWFVPFDYPVGQWWITGKQWAMKFRCVRKF